MTTSNITRAGAEVHKVNGEDKHELLGVVVALYNKDSRFFCSVVAPDSTFTRYFFCFVLIVNYVCRVRDPTKPPYEIKANLAAPPDLATQQKIRAHLASRESIGEVVEVPAPGPPGTPTSKDVSQQSDSDPFQTPGQATPSSAVQSRSGRTLKQPAKFSPSKLIFDAAAKRRLRQALSGEEKKTDTLNPNDGAGEEEGSESESKTSRRGKRPRSTGGIRPKGYEDLAREAKRQRALEKARLAKEKNSTKSDTTSSSEDTESDESSSESEEDTLDAKKNGFQQDGGTNKNETVVPAKESKTSRGRTKKVPAAAADGQLEVAFREVGPRGQGSTINLAQIAMQFENMDKLRALIRGRDPVPTVLPPAPPPKTPDTKEEKLSMKEMFTMFTDFARAVREPALTGPAAAQGTAPAAAPPAPAPSVAPPPPPPGPPAVTPVAASPLTIENFVALMQAFQQNLK